MCVWNASVPPSGLRILPASVCPLSATNSADAYTGASTDAHTSAMDSAYASSEASAHRYTGSEASAHAKDCTTPTAKAATPAAKSASPTTKAAPNPLDKAGPDEAKAASKPTETNAAPAEARVAAEALVGMKNLMDVRSVRRGHLDLSLLTPLLLPWRVVEGLSLWIT